MESRLSVVPPEGEPEGNTLTIEQLSALTGMTVRNIRAHRARELLPAPEVRDRIGYYGPVHVERLRAIQELQAEGFNLKGIKKLLEETKAPPSRLLELKRAVTEPFEGEAPEVLTLADLEERFGPDVNPVLLGKAQRLGILMNMGDGTFEIPAPSLIDAAVEVMSHGVPLSHAITVVGKMHSRCEAIAKEFVRLFLDDVWKPFVAAGYPEERWDEVVEAIDRLRPLSSQALLAVYGMTMTRQVESAFGKELERYGKERG